MFANIVRFLPKKLICVLQTRMVLPPGEWVSFCSELRTSCGKKTASRCTNAYGAATWRIGFKYLA